MKESLMRQLLAATAAALSLAALRAGPARQAQGLLGLCRPGRRFRLFLPARPGRQQVEKALGDKVETHSSRTSPKAPMPSAPSSASPARAASSSSRRRSASWIRRSRSPKKFPDVKFEHATGYKKCRQRRDLQRAFLRRPLRAWARSPPRCRRAGTAGYIVSFPIPEVVMGINAFMLGAQSVNPTSRSRSSG